MCLIGWTKFDERMSDVDLCDDVLQRCRIWLWNVPAIASVRKRTMHSSSKYLPLFSHNYK